jgi:hypothetical protein
MGPHGHHRRNSKGETLLGMYWAHKLRVMNTFFPPKDRGPHRYGTWTNMLPINQRAT